MEHLMEKVTKGLMIVAYIFLMIAVLDFKISLIMDLPTLLYLVIGTGILTGLSYKTKQRRNDLIVRIRINLLITSVIFVFLSELALFSESILGPMLYKEAIQNFMPLFYAMLLILLLDLFRKDSEGHLEKKGTYMGEIDNRLDGLKRQDQQAVNQLHIGIPLDGLGLTKRERDIALILYEDLSNKEIADQLYISENTVKKHIQHIYSKADVTSRTEFIYKYEKPAQE